MLDSRSQVPKSILVLLNQLYEMERKLAAHGDPSNLGRNIGRIKDSLAEEGVLAPDGRGGQVRFCLGYEDPMGQPFQDTRTDLEATIAGSGTEQLVVVEVIKPVIRATISEGITLVVQQGVVVVESQTGQANHE